MFSNTYQYMHLEKEMMVTMLIDQICELRDKLNKSILTEDYDVTYELSIKLDELIAQFYKQDVELKEATADKNNDI